MRIPPPATPLHLCSCCRFPLRSLHPSRCLSFPHPRHCKCRFLSHLAPHRLRLSLPRRGLSPPAPRFPLAVHEEAHVSMPRTVFRRLFGLSPSLLPNRLRFPQHSPNRLRLPRHSPSQPSSQPIVVFSPCLLTSRLRQISRPRPIFGSRPRQISRPRKIFAFRPIAALSRPRKIFRPIAALCLFRRSLLVACPFLLRLSRPVTHRALCPSRPPTPHSSPLLPRTISQSLRRPLPPPTP